MGYLFAALIAAIGLNALQLILHYREKEGIFNRYMAGNYGTYQYFKKQFPVEVEDIKEKLEKDRKKEPTELERELKKKSEGF